MVGRAGVHSPERPRVVSLQRRFSGRHAGRERGERERTLQRPIRCWDNPRDMTLLLIGAGGFAGAIARYLVDTTVAARAGAAFPLGTFVVNVTGSFVVGILFALTAERPILPPEVRPALMIGFLGAYTTFSTWMLESWRLVEGGSYAAAVANIVVSVAAGGLAVVAGLVIGRAI